MRPSFSILALGLLFGAQHSFGYDSASAIVFCKVVSTGPDQPRLIEIYRDGDTSLEKGQGFIMIDTGKSSLKSAYGASIEVRLHQDGTADVSAQSRDRFTMKGLRADKATTSLLGKTAKGSDIVASCKPVGSLAAMMRAKSHGPY